MDIVRELLAAPQPQASVTKDVTWTRAPAAAGASADGWFRNKKCAGINKAQQDRIDKFRKKGFWLVESCLLPNGHVRLFHGTNGQAASAIVSTNFRESTSGNLGPGVYMSRHMDIIKQFSKPPDPAILSAEVDLKTLVILPARDPSWHPKGDSAFLSVENSWRGLEEWCIKSAAGQISNIVREN
jgi:hypothetical protein